MLETRYLYHRLEWAAARLPHLDMLHVARRFWRGTAVASGRRDGRVELFADRARAAAARHAARRATCPGSRFPARYFQFVRTGDARPLQVVLEHNRLDLLSLAALTARALHLVRMGPEQARGSARGAGARMDLRARRARGARPSGLRTRGRSLPGTGSSASQRLSVRGDPRRSARSLALCSAARVRTTQAAGCWRQILEVRGARVTSLAKPAPRSRSITSIASATSRRRRISPCAAWNTARTRVARRRSPSGGPTREEDEPLPTGCAAGLVRWLRSGIP